MSTCNRCGKSGLHWERGYATGEWELWEANDFLHTCEIVAGSFDRNGLYAAVDEMEAHELRELIGYASERLLPMEENDGEHKG